MQRVVVFVRKRLNPSDMVSAVPQMRLDCLAQESLKEVAHAEFSLEETAAVASHVDLAHGIDFLKKFQALAGAPLADTCAGNDIVEADRLRGTEKNPKDLTVRLWKPERVGEVDEKMDDFGLDLRCQSSSYGRSYVGSRGRHGGRSSWDGRVEKQVKKKGLSDSE